MNPAFVSAQDAPYYREILHDLIELGMTLVRRVAAHAEANPGTLCAAAEAYERISRGVRRSILLAHRLDHVPALQHRRAVAKRQVIRGVEDAIGKQAATAEDAEHFTAELNERLELEDIDDEIDDDRPIAEIIADICHDLGLGARYGTTPWKRRTPADIAALCERAARRTPAAPAEASPRKPKPSFHIVPTQDDS